MSKRGIIVLAVVLVAAAGCAPKANAPKDVAAVKAQMAAYGPASSSGDAAAVAELYADGAVRLSANTPLVVGKDAIRAQWQASYDNVIHKETDAAEDVQVVGDLAVARGVWQATDTPKLPGAAIIQSTGKQIFVYRRQPDNAWKIIADIWNSDLPAVQTLTPETPDEFALLQIERDWAAAWLAQDAAALDAILADSFVENELGQISTKAQILANIKAGIYKVEACENSDMRVVVFGDHAVVNGLNASKQALRGKDVGGVQRWTDTFVKQDGRWRAVFSHLVKGE
jgi:uncharacterized protein (TIGR02246 family)